MPGSYGIHYDSLTAIPQDREILSGNSLPIFQLPLPVPGNPGSSHFPTSHPADCDPESTHPSRSTETQTAAEKGFVFPSEVWKDDWTETVCTTLSALPVPDKISPSALHTQSPGSALTSVWLFL